MVFETLRKFRYHLLVSGNGKFAGESVQKHKGTLGGAEVGIGNLDAFARE